MKDRLFILFQHCTPQHTLSRLTGLLATTRITWLKNWLIQLFIQRFDVDMSEAAEEDYRQYPTFNDFFTRKLKDNVRSFDQSANAILSPADGVISEIGAIHHHALLQAKGKHYSLQNLLGGDADLTSTFKDGHFATIYLSPKDYHRVHMPLDGTLIKSIYVPGKLFSVNQTTANHVDSLFVRNERLVCIFDTDAGQMAVILVGAMIVAGIETVWNGQIAPPAKQPLSIDYSKPIKLKKGDEMGLFKLGSTVILMFQNESADWDTMLANQHPLKVGQRIATYRAQTVN